MSKSLVTINWQQKQAITGAAAAGAAAIAIARNNSVLTSRHGNSKGQQHKDSDTGQWHTGGGSSCRLAARQ